MQRTLGALTTMESETASRRERLVPLYAGIRVSAWQKEIMSGYSKPAYTGAWSAYRRIVVCDTEFFQPPGHPPKMHCWAAKVVGDSGHILSGPPDKLKEYVSWLTDPETLWVFFYACADISAILYAGYPAPTNVLDLFAEYRCLTNSTHKSPRAGLLQVMEAYGLKDAPLAENEAEYKKGMQVLAGTTPYLTGMEFEVLVSYCKEDTQKTAELFTCMRPQITLSQARLRGRYMKAVARMELAGIPVDVERVERLRAYRTAVQLKLISRHPLAKQLWYGGSFSQQGFLEWIRGQGVGWPQYAAGVGVRPALDKATFKAYGKGRPDVQSVADLRLLLSQVRTEKLAIGPDGRNRCMLSPFASRTGRNQPSNSRFIFGQAKWMRGFVRPGPGRALAYIDWSQQEFGIGAVLSRDQNMMESYLGEDDPYVVFGKQSGVVKPDFKKSDPGGEATRNMLKGCMLGAQYGIGAQKLSDNIGSTVAHAQMLLAQHKKVYRQYWRWVQRTVTCHSLFGKVQTVLGWQMRTDANSHYGTVINFPTQATGAEMLRLACCLLTEAGITVCAPVHDAVLIEADADKIEDEVLRAQVLMKDASAIILDGFELGTDARIIHHPHSYCGEDKHVAMWGQLMGLVGECATDPVIVQGTLFGDEE